MKCNDIQELILTDYLDGEIHPDIKRQVDSHIADCQVCREFLAVSRQVVDEPFKHAQPKFENQEKVWQKIKFKIEEEVLTEKFTPQWNWLERMKSILTVPRVSVALSVVVIALLTAAVYFRSSPHTMMVHQSSDNSEVINDVVEELSMGEDEEDSYGTDLESYFL